MAGIVIVGEAWGKDEEEQGKPFVGASGRLLTGLLKQVGIDRESCYITNVFNFKPDKNDIKTLCGTKKEGVPGMPAITKGKYVKLEYQHELDRLYKEVDSVKPTLIIALGGSASWSLLRTSGIKAIRGAPLYSFRGPKVLPTYHPAAVLREWKLRPILLADLEKARKESEYPEIRRPQREIWVEPTYEDLLDFEARFITPSSELSIDIETIGELITMIGFAPTVNRALVVPFFDDTKPTKNYWPTTEIEIKVWNWVKRICALEKSRLVGQNFLYDINFLWTRYGITVPHVTDDTMLLHHALQPEMEKGLGFLGSIYTDEAAWKCEYKNSKTVKRED